MKNITQLLTILFAAFTLTSVQGQKAIHIEYWPSHEAGMDVYKQMNLDAARIRVANKAFPNHRKVWIKLREGNEVFSALMIFNKWNRRVAIIRFNPFQSSGKIIKQ